MANCRTILAFVPFQRQDYRATAKAALDEAIGSDRGDAIVAAQIGHLRGHGILLPAATILERIGLAARARARKQAHKNLVEGLEHETIAGLEALIAVESDQDRTPLAWVREWPEAPTRRTLSGLSNAFKPSGISASAQIGNNELSRALRGNRSGNRHSERSTSLAVRCAAPIGHSGRFRS